MNRNTMKTGLALALLWLGVFRADAARVKVSSFGFDAADSTRFVQAALDSGASEVVLDRQASPWVVTPVVLRSDTTLMFEDGVELVAKKGAFLPLKERMLYCTNVVNVKIVGCGLMGGTLRMHRTDYTAAPYVRSEWRHALWIGNARNVLVSNMSFVESGGDGICIGGRTSDVRIEKCVCDHNHRQGISVISADNLVIRDCVLSNTCGVLPRAGIDFEPDQCGERISRCRMENCRIFGNGGAGIDICLIKLNGASEPIGLAVENCVLCGNAVGVRVNVGSSSDSAPRGDLTLKGCVISQVKSKYDAMSFGYKPAGFPVVISDCTILDSEKWLGFVGDTSCFAPLADGIRFENLTVCAKKGADGFGRIKRNLCKSLPTDITGTYRICREEDPCEIAEFGATWIADHFAAPENPDFPRKGQTLDFSARGVRLRDGAPGRMVRLAPLEVEWGGRYVFFAEQAMKVHLKMRDVQKGTGGKILGSGILVRSSLYGPTIKSLPHPDFEPTVVEIDVPKRGFYFMQSWGAVARFVIDEADVPVAFMLRGPQLVCLPGEQVHEVALSVPDGADAFGLLVKSGEGNGVGLGLADPAGKEVWRDEARGDNGWRAYASPKDPAAGLWRLALRPPAKGKRGYFSLDLSGSSVLMFLSPEKTVEFASPAAKR